uniref:Delta-cadinene synthase n=1 Tax=Leonurus sibiricus TaxID=405945 RepID=A0A8F8AJI5_9LAMI|nr:delta-cadinene synthase [Leonurus sibiricus]
MDVALVTTCSRPLANFHPSKWGDRFLLNTPQSTEAREKQVVEELKFEVRRELKEASNDYLRQLKMVDAIQRLGVEYRFEDEINEALQNIFEKFDKYCIDKHDLYVTALSFRLLRQHGYTVSCQIFDKFKDDEDLFKVPDVEEALAVVEFFEAAHLRIRGEDVLDDAVIFSKNYLESNLASLSNPIAEQVRHALYGYSIRRGLPRVEARNFISIYKQYASHDQRLLELAKLDFNMVQAMHKRELSELSRWWKCLEVPSKLSFARDRLVETYFWDVGVYFEPQYARARNILVKVQSLVSLIDDTFDAYGTFEELQLFTDAIQRWSISCLDQLPDYMKIIYKALLEVFEEIEKEMIKQGTIYRHNYGIQAIKLIVGAYFDEVKWREEKYKPTTQEYMQVATKSSGYVTLLILSFLGMEENVATREAFEWVFSRPDAVRATLTICRLTDDIVGHEFEQEREHIPSAVHCYAEEHKVCKEEAILEFSSRIEAAWKDINEVFLQPTKFASPLLYRILNFARIIEVIYTKGDWYTHVGPEMQSFINQLFIDPVP